MKMRNLFRLSALAAAPLFLYACAGDAPEQEPETAPVEAMAETDSQAAADMDHVVVALNTANDSGVSGEAMAMHTDESVVVMVELTGLPAAGEYAAHIHQGTCAAGGGVAAPLNPVMGLADGTGASTTTLAVTALEDGVAYYVQVHGEGGAPIACGDMEGHGA